MKKELELKIPTDWSGVTLKKYLALRADIESYKDDEEATTAVMLLHLCGLEPTYLKSLPVDAYTDIKDTIASFVNNVELPLQKFINIDGIEYGFEPNLSKMAYGAYADITKHKVLEINTDWANIMNILYRPIKYRKGENYEIAKYIGDTDSDKFLSVGMDVHFGALFFFIKFINGLAEFYPELYEGSGESSQHQINFGKKWSAYSTIIELAQGDITKIDKIVEEPLEKCLLYLSFKADRQYLETLMHKEAMNAFKH